MDAQTVTILSGVVLLVVFALAGWVSRKKRQKRSERRRREGIQS
jgi:LPXTG-motif cell wall-anchored protein